MRNLRIYTGLRKRARLMQQQDRRMLQRKSRTWVSQQSHRTIPQRRKVRRPGGGPGMAGTCRGGCAAGCGPCPRSSGRLFRNPVMCSGRGRRDACA